MTGNGQRALLMSSATGEQGDEQQQRQEAVLEQHLNYDDEQLINGEHEDDDYEEEDDDDDDDDGESECHYLISGGVGLPSDSQHQVTSSGASGGGKRQPLLSYTTTPMGPHHYSGASTTNPNVNILSRLASYLLQLRKSRSNGSGTKQDTIFDDISTSDFAYQANWHDQQIANNYHNRQQSAASKASPRYKYTTNGTKGDRLPAFYNGSPTSSLSWPSHHNHHPHHHHNQTRSQTSKTKPCLLIVLFLLLIMSTCMLLVRLLSLVQEERIRLVGNDGANSFMFDNELDESHRRQLEVEKWSRWLVSTPKCHIPVLDPWDKSIRAYVRTKPPMNCSELIEAEENEEEEEEEETNRRGKGSKRNRFPFATKAVSYVSSNRLCFKGGVLSDTTTADGDGGGGRGRGGSQCCFKRVSRSVENDDDLEYSDECTPIREQCLYINSSIVEVNCPALNYTNVHSFIVHNQEEEEALKRVAEHKLNDSSDYYNVLMVGVDTISRLNGQRQLNRTLQLLMELYHTLQFVGYNKVGENTFPNLIPLLTGLKPEQLTEIQCWMAKNYTQENDRGDDYLDNCKYLWNYYQQVGYRTYFSEDWPAASTFNYLKPGFKNEPTTYYGRPFTLAREKLLFPKFKSIGCASCQLDRPIVEEDLNNLRGFIQNNENKLPYFAFHWINCPQHDDLNGASQVDHILEKFFRDLHHVTQDDKTFVIFFSDHGYRWNDFVSTRIGHYESSLPLMTIAPPRRFIERHPELYEHMKSHQNSLLTPFDIFKTLIDLKDLISKSQYELEMRASRTEPSVRSKRQPSKRTTTKPDTTSPMVDQHKSAGHEGAGTVIKSTSTTTYPTASTSIQELKVHDGTTFKQKFKTLSLLEEHSQEDLDRSCIDAGIPDNYCVCQQFDPIDATRLDVLGAAYYLVYVHLWARLRNHLNICHELDLEKVHQAGMFDFESTSSTNAKTLRRRRRKSRHQTVGEPDESDEVVWSSSSTPLSDGKKRFKTSSKPARARSHELDDSTANKSNYLPNREYSIMFSTKPGGGLFQEVVRYYGDSMTRCKAEIEKHRTVVEDIWADSLDRHRSLLSMNSVCEFSVHSESLSRFNLYKDQSKCVTSDIELKKICYCTEI